MYNTYALCLWPVVCMLVACWTAFYVIKAVRCVCARGVCAVSFFLHTSTLEVNLMARAVLPSRMGGVTYWFIFY